MLKRSETTGHDLLDQYATAAAAFQAQLEALASQAQDREAVVDGRLSDLEKEKLVLKQLKLDPKVLVARAPVPDAPQD